MKARAEALILPKPLNLIGGDWRPAASGDEMDVLSPIDGAAFTTIATSTPRMWRQRLRPHAPRSIRAPGRS